MISSNPAFQVLVASANSAALTAGSTIGQLAPGQIGFFSYATNLAIDGTTLSDNKAFYIAVGLDPLNTGAVTDVRKSIGNSIEKRGVRALAIKPYQAAVNKKFLITFGAVKCGADYALKFNVASESAYRNYGFNTPSKTYTATADPCANCVDCAVGDTNSVIIGLAQNIALDSEKLFTTRYVDPSDGSTINDPVAWESGFNSLATPGVATLTPSASGGTLAAGVHHYAVVAVNANGVTALGPNASATTTGTTGSVGGTFTAVSGAVSYRIYRGVAAGVYTDYITTNTNSFTDTGAAGTAGTGTTGSTANANEIMQLEVTVSAAQLYNYAQINLNYLNPRTTDAFLSMIGFGTDTTSTITTALVYEDGAGYDIAQREYVAAGWEGSPYRQSALYGLAFDNKYPPLANKADQYWVASITHENIGIGGGEKYHTSLLNEIALPTANTTAINSVSAIIHRIIDDASGNDSTVNGLFSAEFSEVFE